MQLSNERPKVVAQDSASLNMMIDTLEKTEKQLKLFARNGNCVNMIANMNFIGMNNDWLWIAREVVIGSLLYMKKPRFV